MHSLMPVMAETIHGLEHFSLYPWPVALKLWLTRFTSIYTHFKYTTLEKIHRYTYIHTCIHKHTLIHTYIHTVLLTIVVSIKFNPKITNIANIWDIYRYIYIIHIYMCVCVY